jgi:hypothetical protein
MAIDRRGFLGALALAPAAIAGCVGGSAAGRSAAPGGAGTGDALAPAAARSAAATAVVRSFPLAADVEPAFVFRATAARPGEK